MKFLYFFLFLLWIQPVFADSSLKTDCDGGDSIACYRLGVLEYQQGNIEGSRIAFNKGCDGGDEWACYSLGIVEERQGNMEEARTAYQKGCDLGYSRACDSGMRFQMQ